MTYRQLLAAIEQANTYTETLDDLKSRWSSKATAEENDLLQASINSVEKALDCEIDE